MRPENIVDELKRQGITQVEIARKFGVSHVMIHQVIYGRSKSHRIQEEIARILGKEIDEIWPSKVA